MRPTLHVSTVSAISKVSALAWNALVSENDPFTRHEFLLALEQSGSVGPATGWVPLHLLVHQEGVLVAAVPLYLKNHSYGEYIFDWSWANAAAENGIPYYPKLVSAVPFTPATGPRVLCSANASTELVRYVFQALRSLAQEVNAHSVHVLFITADERKHWESEPQVFTQTTHQYHWQNTGIATFDAWVTTFRARRRKDVLRERKQVEKLGVEVDVLRGAQMEDVHWEAVEANYRRTVAAKGGAAYLTPAFFKALRTELPQTVLAFIASKDGVPVASSLCFQQGRHLYGRYWGCDDGYRGLHFELCYHRPIQHCIENGLLRFEAGAQGTHKIQRGLLPAPTHSAHWVAHDGLHRAIERAVSHGNASQMTVIEELKQHGPFHRRPS